ncbi:YaiI/YqxD family protein [Sutcliffiella sp. NPDC057660]|uniref:YaiI/YqxD family protein n=1 Tax=Sutcliffiella sp. NPDC057660 TaxID=3346199 RepID=UPI003682654D
MQNNRQPIILVDADACPVKEEISSIGHTYQLDVYFVASYSHVVKNEIKGIWVYVDDEKESADLYILNHARKNDVVVTQDHGLASMLVSRNVYVLSPRGKQYEESEMDMMLHMRFLSAKERRKGNYSKGPKAFSQQNRENFVHSFKKTLSNIAGIRE